MMLGNMILVLLGKDVLKRGQVPQTALITYNTLDMSVEVMFCDDANGPDSDAQGDTQAIDTATIPTTRDHGFVYK